VVAMAKQSGIGRHQSCEVLQISMRRIQRWESRLSVTGAMAYKKPGPRQASHTLLPSERTAVKEYAGREETVDYSLMVLSLKAAEAGLFYLSASSVRTVLLQEGLLQDRRDIRKQGALQKPNRPEQLTGPNQCWCWDISYLKTDVRRIFWYLYVMLDEWSRKVVAWRVGSTLALEQAQGLIDDAILSEGLLDVPEDQRPVVVNDNGKQMKAKAVQQMFVDLGIQQTFARPGTPDDNPHIEALFSTTKRSPAYPGWFPADDGTVVQGYFMNYFDWYNKEHYHSGIGYVTPEQKHTGQAEMVLQQRKKQLTTARKNRIDYWRSQSLTDGGCSVLKPVWRH